MNSAPSDVMIRPAVETDATALLAFIRELAEYEQLAHEVTATEDDLRTAFFGPRPAAEALLACVKGEPVGFAVYFTSFSTFVGKPGLYLEDLYVRPTHRGQGFGKRLLLAVAGVATERGCGRYEWSVLDWNAPSIAFYESLGAVMHPDWRRMRVEGGALERMIGL